MHHHLLTPSRGATLLDAYNSASSVQLTDYGPVVSHLLSYLKGYTTTRFLSFNGLSTLSIGGDPGSVGPRFPVTDGLRWTRGDDSDHDFATPRLSGDCERAREGSLGFRAPGTGRPPSVAPGLPVSGEVCAPAMNCRTLPVLKRLDQEPREEGVFVVTLILRAPCGGCG